MEFNNILLDNIETSKNITFTTPLSILSIGIKKNSSKNGEHDDFQTLKTEKYIKDKNNEVPPDHLRQKILEEVTTKLSRVPKASLNHIKLSLMKSHIDSLQYLT